MHQISVNDQAGQYTEGFFLGKVFQLVPEHPEFHCIFLRCISLNLWGCLPSRPFQRNAAFAKGVPSVLLPPATGWRCEGAASTSLLQHSPSEVLLVFLAPGAVQFAMYQLQCILGN